MQKSHKITLCVFPSITDLNHPNVSFFFCINITKGLKLNSDIKLAQTCSIDHCKQMTIVENVRCNCCDKIYRTFRVSFCFNFCIVWAHNEGWDSVELALPIYSKPDGARTHVIDKQPYLTGKAYLEIQIQREIQRMQIQKMTISPTVGWLLSIIVMFPPATWEHCTSPPALRSSTSSPPSSPPSPPSSSSTSSSSTSSSSSPSNSQPIVTYLVSTSRLHGN